MEITAIVAFWRGQQAKDVGRQWAHTADRLILSSLPNTFNLDFPISPYVGNIVSAPVIILNANAGYSVDLTPSEFPNAEAIQSYVARVDDPEPADWSFVSRYYERTNYGQLIASGKAALINACAYRSPRLSQEPENQRLISQLPSCAFTRGWLINAVLPLAKSGTRLIVVKRGGQWQLPPNFASEPGVTRDPAPVSPYITSKPYQRMMEFLAKRG